MGNTPTSSSTTSLPPQVAQDLEASFNNAQSVSQTPFQTYTGQLTAPVNSGQAQAIAQLQGAYGTSTPFTQRAQGDMNQSSQALAGVQNYLQAGSDSYANSANYAGQSANALGGIQQYQNAAQGDYSQAANLATPIGFSQQAVQQYESPYTSDVINATQAQIANTDAQQANQLSGNAIGSGAYGSDRGNMAQAALAGQQDISNNSTIAGLYNQNYAQALGQFNQTNASRQAGAQLLNQSGAGETGLGQLQGQVASQYGQLANTANQTGAGYGQLGTIQGQTAAQYANLGLNENTLGTSAMQNAIAGGSAGLQASTLQQQTQQAKDNANYGQFTRQVQYPFQTSQFLTNAATGQAQNSGSTTQTDGSVLGQVAGVATTGLGILGATGLLSDKRAKEDIKLIGKTFDGQNLYSFKYKGSPQTHTGLIAQEVAGKHPDAVGHMGGGMLGVDYDKATKDASDRGHFYTGGIASGIGNLNVLTKFSPTNGLRAKTRSLRPHFDTLGSVNDLTGGSSALTGGGGDLGVDLSTQPQQQKLQKNGPGGAGKPGVAPQQTQSNPGLGVLSGAPISGPGGGSSSSSTSSGGAGGGGIMPNVSNLGAGDNYDTGATSTPGFSLDKVSPNAWQGVMAAGLGMMASGSMSPLQAIGQGGQQGLQTYQTLQQRDRQNAIEQGRLSEESRHNQAAEGTAALQAQSDAAYRQSEADKTKLTMQQSMFRIGPFGPERFDPDKGWVDQTTGLPIGTDPSGPSPGVAPLPSLPNPTAQPTSAPSGGATPGASPAPPPPDAPPPGAQPPAAPPPGAAAPVMAGNPLPPPGSPAGTPGGPAAPPAASGPVSKPAVGSPPAPAAPYSPSVLGDINPDTGTASPFGAQAPTDTTSRPTPAPAPYGAKRVANPASQPAAGAPPVSAPAPAPTPATAQPIKMLPVDKWTQQQADPDQPYSGVRAPSQEAMQQAPVRNWRRENQQIDGQVVGEGQKAMEASSAAAQTAQEQQMRLAELDNAARQSIATGAGFDSRLAVQKYIAGGLNTLGVDPASVGIDPAKIAEGEAVNKISNNLAFTLFGETKARAQSVVKMATATVPNGQLTDLGRQRVSAGMNAEAQRVIDYAAYVPKYLAAHAGDASGMLPAFQHDNPIRSYADRAVVSTIDPIYMQALAKSPTATNQEQFEKRNGPGTAQIALRYLKMQQQQQRLQQQPAGQP